VTAYNLKRQFDSQETLFFRAVHQIFDNSNRLMLLNALIGGRLHCAPIKNFGPDDQLSKTQGESLGQWTLPAKRSNLTPRRSGGIF
jgi:hypothetical protein